MAKTLMAFFSRADENYFGGFLRYIEVGNTEVAAGKIKEMIGADLFKIEMKTPYAKDYNTCIAQAKEDKKQSARPELVTLPESTDQYDTVILGYPIICDFGNRVKFGKNVFINHSAILSASGEIEFEDGSMASPGLRIATINHDMNERHTRYTYGKVLVKKNAWLGMNVTICPGVTIGEYAVVGAGAVVTKDVPDYAVVGKW